MIATTVISAFGQQAAKEFLWVNPLPMGVSYPGVSHHTFISPSMRHEVGYCIYLPPRYDDATNSAQRYPVVYYLDGSRPGSEIRSISLAETIHAAISDGTVPAAIYVWVNGGEVSHYNYPSKNSMGEDVFVKELIPHVDRTYRTIAERRGRAIEGFSQGGRGTTRIMFKYPHLFVSAAPGGAGHATEQRISENNGRESEDLKFARGYNTYDLARAYVQMPKPSLNIMIYVGTKGFNYENNLEYMSFLDTLGIKYWKMIVPDVADSSTKIYEAAGVELMKFHARNFAAASE